MVPMAAAGPAGEQPPQPSTGLWRRVIGSAYSPDLYLAALRQPGERAWAAFTVFMLLLTVLWVVVRATWVSGMLSAFSAQASGRLLDLYPPGLVVTIHDGTVSTNANGPVAIPVPPEWRDGNGVANLLVIDTQTPVSNEAFDRLDTLIWLSRTSVVARDNSGLRMTSLKSVSDLRIDRQAVAQALDLVLPWLQLAVPILVAGLAIGGFFWIFVGSIIRLVWLTVLSVIVARLMGLRLGYGRLFVLGLYATLWPTALAVVLGLAGVNTHVPFLPSILTLALLTYMLHAIKLRVPAPAVLPAQASPAPALTSTAQPGVYCRRCGQFNPAGAPFCSACGLGLSTG